MPSKAVCPPPGSCECAAPAAGTWRGRPELPSRPRGFGPDASFPGVRFGRVSASSCHGPGGLAGAAPGAQRVLLAGTAGWRGLCGFSRPGQSGLTGPHASSYRGPLTLSKSGFYGPLPKSYRMPGLVITGSSNLLSALLQVRKFTIETGSDQFVKGVPIKGSAPQLAFCPVHCGSL